MAIPTRTKLVVATLAAFGVAAIVLAIALYPISVTYRLWRYRRDPDAVKLWMPPLCEAGHADVPYIYAAFAKHGNDPDVARFRAGILAELRCIRRKEGEATNEANWYRDLPAEPELTSTIVRAFTQEPDPAIRHDMLVFINELDFRAWFAIWAGMASSDRDTQDIGERVPPIDAYDHRRRGIAHDYATITAEWCRVVRPVVMKQLEAMSGSPFGRSQMLIELGRARCDDSDLALLRKVARSGRAMEELGAARGLVAAADTVEHARQALLPLFDDGCDFRLVSSFEHELAPPIASLVATSLARCLKSNGSCEDVDEATCIARETDELTTRH